MLALKVRRGFKVRLEQTAQTELMVRQVQQEQLARRVQPDQQARLAPLALAWRPEVLLGSFLLRRHRPITTRLGESQSQAVPPLQQEVQMATSIFNMYDLVRVLSPFNHTFTDTYQITEIVTENDAIAAYVLGDIGAFHPKFLTNI
jgi:hypothetical protein